MTMVTVRVTKPGNRLVYINGNHIEAAGNSSVDSFTVPTGGQVFETLTHVQAVVRAGARSWARGRARGRCPYDASSSPGT